jgi:predicted nucleotidyltransferase component of viral defense system
MIRILKDIFSDTSIGPFLGFKGGTAVYLFYNLPRFSVDLDFDLLDLQKREHVFERVKNILAQYGTIKDQDKKHENLFFNLSYTNKEAGAQNVKVDISSRQFGSKYEIKEHIGISMNVMVREDIFAHKLVAMYERGDTTNRDIFDVWFFFKNNWPVNRNIVETRTGLSYKEFLQKLIEPLAKAEGRDMLAALGELVESEKEKDWIRKKLQAEAIFFLRLAQSNEK